MGEHGETAEYIYWSTRRTGRFLEDHNLVPPAVTTIIATPSFGWLPTISRSKVSVNGQRPQVAKVIEKALKRKVVEDFDSPLPIEWAKGTGPVVFGEFTTVPYEPDRKPAVMFTVGDCSSHDRGSVAVCLYGSIDNFLEFIQGSGPGSKYGWASSASKEVFNFIKSHGTQLDDPYYEREIMAVEALKIAVEQGLHGSFENQTRGFDEPWRRGYTYGDAREAEWLAKIYLDVDLEAAGVGRVMGYKRVLIGAPMWIRTPDPQALRLYATPGDLELERREFVKKNRDSSQAWLLPMTNLLRGRGDPPLPGGASYECGSVDSADRIVSVPANVYNMLRGGFIQASAEWAMVQINRAPSGQYRLLHLGDPFGTVFAWIWERDRDQAMRMLADFLSVLNRERPSSELIDPLVRLDEVLKALHLALPSNFDRYDDVVTMAHRDLRKYYGKDPNA